MPENSSTWLPILVLNFGDVSPFQYCAGNFSQAPINAALGDPPTQMNNFQVGLPLDFHIDFLIGVIPVAPKRSPWIQTTLVNEGFGPPDKSMENVILCASGLFLAQVLGLAWPELCGVCAKGAVKPAFVEAVVQTRANGQQHFLGHFEGWSLVLHTLTARKREESWTFHAHLLENIFSEWHLLCSSPQSCGSLPLWNFFYGIVALGLSSCWDMSSAHPS